MSNLIRKLFLINLDFNILLLAIFFLPFGNKFFLPILFFWICLVLFSYIQNKDFSFKRKFGLLIIPIVFYLFLTLRLLFECGNQEIGSDLLMKFYLILVPILFPYYREIYKSNFDKYFWSLFWGCFAVSTFYLLSALYHSISYVGGVLKFNPVPEYGWDNYFIGYKLSFLLHPSYFSLLILVALLFIGIRSWKNIKKYKKILLVIIIIQLVLTLILIQSRAGILGLGLLVLIKILHLIFIEKRFVAGMVIFVVLVIPNIIVFSKLDRYSKTIKSLQATTSDGINHQYKEDVTLIRFWIWQSAFNTIKENPIFGVGTTSNVRDSLKKRYEVLRMESAASLRLNAHNQFFETWLSLGIFGLVILIFMIFMPLIIGVRNDDWLMVGFFCLSLFSFTFESMLERISGIVFFIIFYTILVSQYLDSKMGKGEMSA